MTKADDTTSTDWIWLRVALELVFAAFGSMERAKTRLRQWMATGELPWDCMDWEALDDEEIAELRRTSSVIWIHASVAYYRGDPRFWDEDNNLLKITWEDNAANEDAVGGAHAWGIKVPRARLLELLPGGTREDEQVRGAGAWIAAEARRMKEAEEIPPEIGISDFARELESRMRKAAVTNKGINPIKWRSIKNELRAWGLWPIDSIK